MEASSFCSRLSCSAISDRKLIRRDSAQAQAIISRFENGGDVRAPRQINLSHDRSCNLSCPSCRSENIIAGKSKQSRLDDLVETKLLPILAKAESVYITGSGDPFGSAHFRRLLKYMGRSQFPNLAIHLHTNGQLWDERAWRELDLEGRVHTAHISIDAAEPATYAILRRGGTFQRLLRNLEFIKVLRQSGELKWLTTSMVVQKLNYREMPAFVRLGKQFAVDEISFQMIRNWGTYSAAEFAEAYIGPSHAAFADLARVIEAPELSLPGVCVGNIRTHIALAA